MAHAPAGKVLLTKEIITQIKSRLDELEGKEVAHGAVFGLSFSGEHPDQPLSGAGHVTAAWSIEITRGNRG